MLTVSGMAWNGLQNLEINKMKTIKAVPTGGNSFNLFVNDFFVGEVENEGSSFDAVEDYLLDANQSVDDYIVIEAS
jgi:hypothetical protein